MKRLLFAISCLLLSASSSQASQIIKGEWMGLVDGKFVEAALLTPYPGIHWKYLDCIDNTCQYVERYKKYGSEYFIPSSEFRKNVYCDTLEYNAVTYYDYGNNETTYMDPERKPVLIGIPYHQFAYEICKLNSNR